MDSSASILLWTNTSCPRAADGFPASYGTREPPRNLANGTDATPVPTRSSAMLRRKVLSAHLQLRRRRLRMRIPALDGRRWRGWRHDGVRDLRREGGLVITDEYGSPFWGGKRAEPSQHPATPGVAEPVIINVVASELQRGHFAVAFADPFRRVR